MAGSCAGGDLPESSKEPEGDLSEHARFARPRLQGGFPRRAWVRPETGRPPADEPERVRIARNLIDRREEIELITHPDILVIEDDVQLQTTIEAAFEDEGLQPAIAATGEEAVTLLKSDLSDYRALVVDIRLLGRIDGWEVARTARRIDPNLPVVYITGAAAERWETQGVPSSVLLRKPFALADLVTVIRRLLDKGSGAEP